MMSRHPHRSAFTLIELLVVISIIAVLAAMLLPAIGSVRAMSQQTACLNNQRQMMAALIAYAGENDGRLPPCEGNDTGDIARTPVLMLIYWEMVEVSQFQPTYVAGRLVDGQWKWPNTVSCPAVNPGTPNPTRWFFSSRMTSPAGVTTERIGTGGGVRLDTLHPRIPYLAETCGTNPITTGYWANWFATSAGPRLTHRYQANVSYKDGHISARTRTQLIDEDLLTGFNIWSAP